MKTELTIPRLRRSHAPESGCRVSPAIRQERRIAACARILVALEAGPLAAGPVADLVGLNRSTGYAHLKYMASELRTVRRAGHDEEGRVTWELGEDFSLPTPDECLDAAFAARHATVPARQLGMSRDSLVAAFFGPAHN